MYHFILEPWKENHNLCSQQTLKLTKMTILGKYLYILETQSEHGMNKIQYLSEMLKQTPEIFRS